MKESFAFVTDIHYGFDHANKKGSHAPRLIDRYVGVANRSRVDFAVDNGDRVIQKDRTTDLFYLTKLKEHFNKLAMPKYSVDGNHDRKNLSAADNCLTLDVPPDSYFVDVNGFRNIFWTPSVLITPHQGLKITQPQMDWLKDALDTAPGPCVLFSHVPLDNSADDNLAAMRHDIRPFLSFYPEAEQVRELLENSGKVILCMAGHRHRNRHREINGIHYITHQSLVQVDAGHTRPRGAFSIVKIDDSNIVIKGYGIGQPDYVLPRLTV